MTNDQSGRRQQDQFALAPGDEWLDDASAAAYIHKTKRWLRSARAERRIRFYRVGRQTLWRRSDLDAYVVSCAVPADSPLALGGHR